MNAALNTCVTWANLVGSCSSLHDIHTACQTKIKPIIHLSPMGDVGFYVWLSFRNTQIFIQLSQLINWKLFIDYLNSLL